MEISRRKLEEFTSSVAVTLLSLMVVILTLVVANYTFGWDLFPKEIERVGIVVLAAAFFTIISSVVVNIMLNVGRIADYFDREHGR